MTPFSRSGPGQSSREYQTKRRDIHYFSHDRRMSVWIWHQIILIEVSGRWDPTIAEEHLDRLFDDFKHLRQQWNKIHSVIDLCNFEIQSVAFRIIVENYWAKFFNRSDLEIYFVENNALRRAIRAAILRLINRSHNVHLCKNYREISRLLLSRINEKN
jgi:hypothetical protein